MKTILNKIASILALVIGLMSIFAGGSVLLGKDPGYSLINWLPLYNYTMGFLAFLVAAPLLWMNSRLSGAVAVGTFSLHAAVMVILQMAYRGVVAPDSLQAMTFRLVVWLAILALLYFQSRLNSRLAHPGLA